MKRLCLFFVFSAVFLLGSCSNASKWKEELNAAIQTADSTQLVFQTELDSAAVFEGCDQSKSLDLALKQAVQSDTLDLSFAQSMDAFHTAYLAADDLKNEWKACKTANVAAVIRLKALSADIEKGVGDRAAYCAQVSTEISELTKIRNHCKDIQRRFERLKTAKEQFEPLFLRYQTESTN